MDIPEYIEMKVDFHALSFCIGKGEGRKIKLPCLINACDIESFSRSLCHKHYANFHYHKTRGRVNDVAGYLKFKNSALS